MNAMLAVISMDAVVRDIFYLIIVGLILWILWWLVSYVGIPEPFNKVARVILAILAAMILIYFLLGLVGGPTPIVTK